MTPDVSSHVPWEADPEIEVCMQENLLRGSLGISTCGEMQDWIEEKLGCEIVITKPKATLP